MQSPKKYKFFENIEKEDKGKKTGNSRNYEVDLENIIDSFYYEEFDPGSGLTLAAGLTHASRGATRIAIFGGDRRTGE